MAELLPRKYQEELFAHAQKGNIIAASDTGSGKTFISTLLVKWVAAQEGNSDKKIFFFVPKVPLVEQQGNFIAKHSTLRVMKLHGASHIDITDRSGWKIMLEKHDVCAAGHSMWRIVVNLWRGSSPSHLFTIIFINFLTHSLINMQTVSLMVFDECHHARKKHPYAIIMTEYMQCPVQDRPKVFGMTASPIWNTKDPAGSLKLLETNLDAKVLGVREHAEELLQHAPKPTEVMKLFPPPPQDFDYPTPSLWTALSVFDLFRTVEFENSSWPDIERRYYVTLYNLGPYSASLYLYTEMSHLITRLFEIYRGTEELEHNSKLIIPRQSSPQEIPMELFDIADVLVDYQSYFSPLDDSSSIPVPLEWCTPKIRTLVDVLRAHHSPTFQGIIFVEQRQVAACLAKILPRIPDLVGLVKCEALVGSVASAQKVSRMGLGNQEQVVGAFREKKFNLLIATSVAEEGLDFPACDVVIRFDSLDHLVGYVQSRGRARNKFSNFIVMIQENDHTYQEKYQKFIVAEPQLKEAYQQQIMESDHDHEREEGAEDEEDESPDDVASRERYTVPSTSAFLTYDNATSLISHLCSLIPHDLYTSQPLPVYTGEFQCTLCLPASLPLPPADLVYIGPIKSTKKEAKRAVSFRAVKRLHELDVFDDYLLPAGSGKGKDFQDIEGRPVPNMSYIPMMMDVRVKDPWVISERLWMHPVVVDGQILAGLITGTKLVPVQVNHRGSLVETQAGQLLEFTTSEDMHRLRLMENYTELGIQIRISTSPSLGRPSLYLVPLTPSLDVDFEAIEELVSLPGGNRDWSSIEGKHFDRLLVRNLNRYGRIHLLHGFRSDLTPMSIMSTTPEGVSQTYRDHFLQQWSRKKWEPMIPETGPMIEVSALAPSKDSDYHFDTEDFVRKAPPDKVLLPQGCCSWLSMSLEMSRAFDVLPPLSRRITDIYRVRAAKFELSLPPILDNLMVQALTIPSALAGYNNQRLETLGDAVLEVCTTVHLLNKYPHRHEGQLDILRQRSICNRFLLFRAMAVGLDKFIISETPRIRAWKLVVEDNELNPSRHTLRKYPRRSLQDCMEATLGAAFLTGGIHMALQAGTALGLTFGGPSPWSLRYDQVECTRVSAMFEKLQEQLGYTFQNGRLLREALTHPSFASVSETIASYQRLEFLGDAILNLAVVHYLYNKYPTAGSEQLAVPRTKAVCAQALASLAVRKLELHKVVLVNNVDLSKAIESYVPHLQEASPQTIINTGWKFDPPKVLSDVFESVIGAVLVDSGYNYEKTAAIVEYIMEDILSILSPSVRLDPITTLVHWISASTCQEQVKFISGASSEEERNGMQVELHGVIVAGPIVSTSLVVAKNLAAERALAILQDEAHNRSLSRVCICVKVTKPEDIIR